MPGLTIKNLERDQLARAGALVALLGLLIWSFWNSLAIVANHWDEPRYSHGYLVPLFSIFLLWIRREKLVEPSNWERLFGIGVVAAGMGIRLVGTKYESVTLEMFSFLPAVLGVFVFVGGWRVLRWAGISIAFLILMYPIPPRLDRGLSGKLQQVATTSSTYALQTLGVASYSEGNRIVINDLQLGVVDACSGLRMLTIFIAMAVAIVILSDRPMWERVTIVLTAIPIAVAVNVIRITVTGLLYLMAERQILISQEMADRFFHDAAGWVMMPMALAMLFLEMKILSHLFIEESVPGPFVIGGSSA